MALVLFLCSFLPPAPDCQRQLDMAESWQAALFEVIQTVPHEAHDDAQTRLDYWQYACWAHCDAFTAEHRAWWLGECFALMAGRALR